MTWKIKFRCRKCNEEAEFLLKFSARNLNSIEGIGRAIAGSLAIHSKEVRLIWEEDGKIKREIRF